MGKGAANIFQLTASQSVDMIKKPAEMHDDDAKGTKSSITFQAAETQSKP